MFLLLALMCLMGALVSLAGALANIRDLAEEVARQGFARYHKAYAVPGVFSMVFLVIMLGAFEGFFFLLLRF